MSCDTNAKLQLIVLLRNVDLAVLSHTDVASNVDVNEKPASGGGGDARWDWR